MDDLANRLARGDREAFAELYDACADRVHHYLVVRLRCREDADDVLQETFVRLARAHKKLAEVDNLMAYVFKVARNEAARLAGRKARRQENEARLAAETLFVDGDDRDSRLREIGRCGRRRAEPPRRRPSRGRRVENLRGPDLRRDRRGDRLAPGHRRHALSDGTGASAASA